MRITYLKLVNFIGIQHGLGTNIFEISFTDNGHKFIKLSGKNGSGKTTILSQLHPFKESFDDRKSLIIPGQEGQKVIEIEANGHDYKIEHFYRKAASSFFYKDGQLLNENGSVGECENKNEKELGITKDYFKIGKIGSNTANFIAMLPTERKNYIGSFITQIDKYNEAFKYANDKYKTQKNKIAETSEILSKYQDPSALNAQIAVEKEQLTNTENFINTTSSEIAVINEKLKTENEKIKDINYSVEKNKLAKLIENIENKTSAISTFELLYGEKDISNIEKEINSTNISIATLNSENKSIDEKISENNTSKVEIENSIYQNTLQLNNIKLDDYDEVVKNIETATKKKTELDEQIKSNQFYAEVGKYADSVSGNISTFKSLMQLIYNNFALLNENTLSETEKNINIIFATNYKSVLSNYSSKLKEFNEKLKTELDNKKSEKSKKEANIDQLSILEKRPANCHIDTCPFIVHALKFKNLPDELNILEKDIAELEKKYSEINENIDSAKNLFSVFSNIINAFQLLGENNIAYKYFVEKYGNISSQFNSNNNVFFENFNEVVQTISNSLSIFNDEKKNSHILEINTLKKKSMDSAKENKEYLETQNKKLEAQLSAINNKVSELSEKKKTINEELNSKNTYLNLLNDYKEAKEIIDSLNSEKEKTVNNISLYEGISKIISGYNSELSNKQKSLDSFKKDKDKITEELNSNIIRAAKIEELQKNLAELQKEYSNIKYIADALNPKSGIPLIFIKSYLDEVERISNELLDLAYNGKFEIKFNVTEKEFKVTVRTNESIIEDIKFASQGELALTTISISLALIERSISNYNIITLDEIDGPLDAGNRAKFINILTAQIEKLGLEQIFIISHNNAFDSCSMDLILLKDAPDDIDNSEYMNNKTILYKF